jgi:lysozyme family protein
VIVNFDECFDHLIGNEGGFTLNPKDRGNWTTGVVGQGELKGTNWGIAAASYPEVDIKNLTKEGAKAIYLKDFWLPLGLDTAPSGVRFQIFDSAVNHGIKRAVKLSQAALGLVVDGVIGPKTFTAIQKATPLPFVLSFNAYRLKYYTSLESFVDFGKGWVNRVALNQLIAASE